MSSPPTSQRPQGPIHRSSTATTLAIAICGIVALAATGALAGALYDQDSPPLVGTPLDSGSSPLKPSSRVQGGSGLKPQVEIDPEGPTLEPTGDPDQPEPTPTGGEDDSSESVTLPLGPVNVDIPEGWSINVGEDSLFTCGQSNCVWIAMGQVDPSQTDAAGLLAANLDVALPPDVYTQLQMSEVENQQPIGTLLSVATSPTRPSSWTPKARGRSSGISGSCCARMGCSCSCPPTPRPLRPLWRSCGVRRSTAPTAVSPSPAADHGRGGGATVRAGRRVGSILLAGVAVMAAAGLPHGARGVQVQPRGPVPVALLTGEPVEKYPILEMDGSLRADPSELRKERIEARTKSQAIGAFDPGELIEDRLAASRQVSRMLRSQASAAQAGEEASWRSVGPHNVGGRTRAIVLHPRTPEVMYAGGIAGGLWKSEDGGESWRPLPGTPDNLPVSSIAMSPQDPNVLYVGTGDTVDLLTRRAAQGAGIMVSRDAGQSWSFLESTRTHDFAFVNQVKVSRKDPRRIYAATRTGFWLSRDGGGSWSRTLVSSDYMGCSEVAVRDDQPTEHLLVSCGGILTSEGVFFSEDGGETWGQTVGSINQKRVGRTAVAFAPSDQNIAYASAAETQADGGFAIALLRSDQGGRPGSWEIVNTPTGQPGSPPWFGWCDDVHFSSQFGQGYYDNVIGVSPTDPDVVFIGGIDNFRSDDGGRTMYPISYWWAVTVPGSAAMNGTPYNHADQHFYVFHPEWDGERNQILYTGNDGGIFRTDNALARADEHDCQATENAVTWTSLNNGYATSLFREGVVSPNGVVTGGLQDNGTLADYDIQPAPNDWVQVNGGDGGWTAIDPTGQIIYTTYPGGYVFKVQNGAITQVTRGLDVDTGLFVPPLMMDPSDPDVLWVGLTRMFRTTNAAEFWEPVGGPTGAGIETMGVSPRNGAFVMISTIDGRLFRTTNGYDALPQWEQIGTGLPAASLSQIAFDPSNDQTVYLTVASFQDVGTVFKSTDGGVTWSNIDGTAPRGIPDTAAYSVAVNPLNTQNVFVGTDTGVFESRDGGASWEVEARRLTTTTVEDLYFQPGTSRLYAFTYGRGVFSAAVGS